jgi:hypothetical protein
VFTVLPHSEADIEISYLLASHGARQRSEGGGLISILKFYGQYYWLTFCNRFLYHAKAFYKYDSPETASRVSERIKVAISWWQAENPFLDFSEVSPASPVGVGGVVTITAFECGGCYPTVGYSSSPGLVLNLQQKCGASSAGCFSNEATHETGHVLGLVHEVKRPDSSQHVTFHCENLIDYSTNGLLNPGCCGLACQFTSDSSYDSTGPY